MFRNFGMNFPVCYPPDSKPCKAMSCSASHSEKFRLKFLLLSVCLFVQSHPPTNRTPALTGHGRCQVPGKLPGEATAILGCLHPCQNWGPWGPATEGMQERRGHGRAASAKLQGAGCDVANPPSLVTGLLRSSPTSELGFQEAAHFLSFFYCSLLFSGTYSLTYTLWEETMKYGNFLWQLLLQAGTGGHFREVSDAFKYWPPQAML